MGETDDAAGCDLLVGVLILPSLMLMSKTRAYLILRILNVETPVDMIVNAFARHAFWIAITLSLVSLAIRFLPGALAQRAMATEMAQFVE